MIGIIADVLILLFIFIINDQVKENRRKLKIQYLLIESLIVDVDRLKEQNNKEK